MAAVQVPSVFYFILVHNNFNIREIETTVTIKVRKYTLSYKQI